MHYAIADFILDITQNAFEAGSRHVELELDETGTEWAVRVTDDGCGMTALQKMRAMDPFYTDGTKHVKRKVGLGLPFLVQTVEQTGGSFSLDSEPGKGTEVRFAFPKGNVDCPPMGDISGLFAAVLCYPGERNVSILRRKPHDRDGYSLDRNELMEVLGDMERVSSLSMLRDFLESQESD